MSYCRWSSDNWKCDVYCYEDVSGGWTTHVAGNRLIGEPPPEPDILSVPEAEWIAGHRAAMAWLETAQYEPITLPHAGAHFNDPTLEEFRARLTSLRALGYNVPDYVFAEIDEEIDEESALRAREAG